MNGSGGGPGLFGNDSTGNNKVVKSLLKAFNLNKQKV
jgi:hypothetical protein